MGKKKPPAGGPAETEPPIAITYDLFDLPTAQHKAGLAGLLLQLKSMANRKKPSPAWRADAAEPASKVHVEFTEATIKALFDDLYDAAWVEGPPREKPFTRGKGDAKREVPPVRTAPISKTDRKGNTKTVDGYVYLELTPALTTLRHYLPEQGQWVKLWRDLIWQVVRRDRAKAPYILRAAAKAKPAGAGEADEPGEAAGDADDGESGKGDGSTWADLAKHQAARAGNTFAVGKLSGALQLGAMASNAETVPLTGRVDHNLLLHFWPLTAMVFVPRFLDRDGGSHIGRRNAEDKAVHYCLAVPEVSDLPTFLNEYPALLAGLRPEQAGIRPREAVIDLPAEGGFSFVEHLARLVPQAAGAGETRFSVAGVDYLHVWKDGNNVKFLATGRVASDPYLAEEYRGIAGRPGEKPPYGNPLFRRGLMQALLDGQPWFRPFGKVFEDWPAEFFVKCEQSPQNLSWFWADARKKLLEETRDMPTDPDPDRLSDKELAALLNHVVRRFLMGKAKKRSNIDPKAKWATLTDDQRRKVKEEKPKVALDAFYKARARHDGDFVAFFTEEIVSSGSPLDPRTADLPRLQTAVIDQARITDVKALTLMALSANF